MIHRVSLSKYVMHSKVIFPAQVSLLREHFYCGKPSQLGLETFLKDVA